MLTTTLKTPVGLALVALLLAYAALHGAWTVFHWGGPEVVARIAGSPLVLPGLVATALAFRRARNEPQPSARHGWGLFAVALTLYSLGLLLFAYYTVVLGRVPFPSPADFLWLAFPWIFFASLMALTREQLSQLERRRVLLSTAVMLGAVGLVEWVLLLRNTVAVAADTPFASVVALLYPLGDLIMVGGLLFTVLLALGRVRPLYLLPMIGGRPSLWWETLSTPCRSRRAATAPPARWTSPGRWVSFSSAWLRSCRTGRLPPVNLDRLHPPRSHRFQTS